MPDTVLEHLNGIAQILADIVRAYVETGEPVSSRAISRSHAESLSPATIRNVMGELEDAGMLYQPHTSAGRVPTASAYRFFAQQAAAQATLSDDGPEMDPQRTGRRASTPEEVAERAGHMLAAVSRGLGIIVMPPLARSVLEHVRFVRLPDGRVVVVLVSPGGATRDKFIRPEHEFTQAELDRTADYLNRHYGGWTLEAIRSRSASQAGFGTRALRTLAARRHWNFAIRRFSTATHRARCTWRVPAQFASRSGTFGGRAAARTCWPPLKKRASWWPC